ncbi:MAG: M20 family peptidase [Actinobacteria bacterium]|jgi:glutamate carboxypeptidase|nr:M20 family peptidase [Actinomycetota bacterium]NBP52942.1 M20 family peptidase [Actinomycetota bacterium]
MNSIGSPYSFGVHPFLVAATASLDASITDIANLVSIESPSRDAERVSASARAVADLIARETGLTAELVDSPVGPHVTVRASARPAVLFLGHHDTVHKVGTLDTRPFTNEAGVLRGPGVFDMKAGIVQAVHATRMLRESGVDLAHVSMLFTADEEVGSKTSRGLVEEMARGVDAVLVLEPSADGGALKIARKGTGTFEVVITGRASHAGLEPEKGINALVELSHQVQRITGFGNPAVGTTVTPTVASAGTTDNTVPDSATILVDARVVTPDEKQRVEALMNGLTPVIEGASIAVTGGLHRPPMHESMSARLFDVARTVAKEIDGRDVTGIAVGGGSDGNFTAAIGIPTLDGLGAVGGGAHGENEHVIADTIPFRTALVAGIAARVIAG